ncbi:MAG TPA: LysR family transcriptional regulator [Sphingomonas sp.]
MITMHPVNLRSIDLNLLVVLQVLLDERHVTQAANRLHMSQPAVSHALSRLRELFGDPLLVRAGSRMLPTSRALGLMQELDSALAGLASLFGSAAFDPATATGLVRICAPEGVFGALLTDAIASLSDRAPHLRIMLSNNIKQAYADLEQGRIDIAFDVPRHGVHAAFRDQPLIRDSLVCATRKGLWNEDGDEGEAAALARYASARHLQIVGEMDHHIARALQAEGRKREVALSTPGYLSAMSLLERSDLVLTLPSLLAAHARDLFNIDIHPLPLEIPPVPLSLIWHRSSETSAALNWARNELIRLVTGRTPGQYPSTGRVPRRHDHRPPIDLAEPRGCPDRSSNL